jgi:signal transduction histidine kinase
MKSRQKSISKIKARLGDLSIAKKIGYGYALAIGIAILGTSIGLIVSEYYQKKAQQRLQLANSQEHLFDSLQNHVLELRSHPQELVAVLDDSIWFQYETSKFKNDLNKTRELLSEIESFTNSYPTDLLAKKPTRIKNILEDYQKTIDLYSDLVESLWQEIDSLNLKPEEIPRARQQVLTAMAGEDAIKIRTDFEKLSDSLTRISITAEIQQKEAYARLQQVQTWRVWFIIMSMALSVTIAAFLAVRTSRAIASPLERLTDVAEKVTRKGDFNLQATVYSTDEVGLLAISLNQLIAWVGEYTRELELARETLEERVDMRTAELKEALKHLRETQSQLIQTEKMSGLGQMVAGVAHEINNPVSFVYGNLNYAWEYSQQLLEIVELYHQHYPDPPEEIKDLLEEVEIDFLKEDLPKVLASMKQGANRIAAIVKSLRTFSRLDESEFKEADINEGIESTLTILEHRLKFKEDSAGIKLIKKYGKIPLINCYAGQLNQVFMNLIANAIDALDECDRRRTVEEIQANPGTILIGTEILDNNWISITIGDNGPGISEEVRAKLFDPFFTTKPVGKGTGLGLAISYQIVVEKHGGKIECHSSVGEGTEFVVKIPINRS